MQGIAQKILAAPERYSVDMLRRAVETGLLPAYIGIPLIQSKMQSQQQMQQSAALSQPSPDQQPTVAEQVMAQGVDALPTNLPQEYAAGGIVAFADGGDVTTAAERLRRAQEAIRPFGFVQRRAQPDAYSAAQQELAAAQADYEAMERQSFPAVTGRTYRNIPPIAPAPAPATAGATGYWDASAPAPAPAPAPRPQGPITAPRAPAPVQGIEALPAAALAAPTLGMPSGPSNRQLAEDAAANLRGVSEMEEQYANQRTQDLRSQLTGKPFEQYKQRIENEARQAGAERADAKNLALIKAGLAMMAGTSRHALTNIGQGAMVGVADWQAAAKDFKTAERERNKELSLIEQAERAEQRGDIKEQMGLLNAARDRRVAQNTALTKLMLDAGYADNQAEAKRLADQFSADAAQSRLKQQLAAQEREGAADRANRLLTTGMQVEGAVRAAGVRGANQPARGQMNEATYVKLMSEALGSPEVQSAALAQLRQDTGVLLRAAPKPTDAAYPQYRAALDSAARQYIERLRPGGASAPAPVTAGATGSWDGWGAKEVTPGQR